MDGTVQVSQRKSILQSLASRGYVHMNGTKILPDPCEGTLPPETRDEQYERRVKPGQSEVGSLMWVVLHTCPDILSTVGSAACMLVNNNCNAEANQRAMAMAFSQTHSEPLHAVQAADD